MNAYDTLPEAVTEIFGAEATAEQAYDLLTVDVPVGSWIAALEIARDKLGCTYFDWLSAVDEPGTGFRVCAHVVALEGHRVRRLLVRTTVPHTAPALPSAVDVYAGAGWHERETYEMFGITFTGHPHLEPLLLPEGFEGHPLRKDFVLASRVAKAWPGAKEPGESHDGGPKRRQMLPPGVPDPNDWGPLKGQLPPAPSRPARTARAAGAGAGAAPGERPARRTRTAGEGSASQTAGTPEAATAAEAPQAETPPRPPRRMRSASQGSASQTAETPPEPTTPAAPPKAPRSSDAPWHHARPAFDEPAEATPKPEPTGEDGSKPEPEPEPEPAAEPKTEPTGQDGSKPDAKPEPAAEAKPAPEAAAEPKPAPSAEARPVPSAERAPDAKPEPTPDRTTGPDDTTGGDPA
ncbi:NADH-quinone oxidoreductase subunit C [Streptomyces purpureus]|uniref:NADH-quinone oxidoreductase subunit C n=1 Tax=Streptomyces purpureus TaxID=1951 RepID=UPI00378D2632